jgi:aspartate aminotransferase
MKLSKRISQISPSATLAITAQAKKMKAEGLDIIGFGAGEPDFDTPDYIKQAAKRAIDSGFTKYTPASGTTELKQAICRKFKADNNLEYAADEILVSCGAKHSIFNAVLALCQEGDEVILPAPYWVSYPEIITACGAKAIILNTARQNNFKVLPEQLRRAITSKTRLLILNSPSNPTGMVYARKELEAIAGIIAKKNILCLADEIYEKIIYDNQEHISIASLGDKIKKQTIVINGVSKSYAMTGWRIGYAAADKEIIQAMSNLQSHSTSNPASISQSAALAALTGPQEETARMVEEFKKRRDYMLEQIDKIKGLSYLKPQGAFYVFVDATKILGGDTLSLTKKLLSEAKVAVVPGEAFGAKGYLRLSYATSMQNITEGLQRIQQFIKTVSN